MEACIAVEREVDKVLNKFSTIKEHASRTLQDVTSLIEPLKNVLAECPENHEMTPEQVTIVNQAMAKAKETVGRLATEHRELHSTVSKVGKAIDRNFVSDFASTSREDVFSSPDKVMLLNRIICQHFYRQGALDIADQLAEEAGLDCESGKEPFAELNEILESLKQKNLDPALEWAEKHRTALEKQNSSLEFKLHQLRFIGLIEKGTRCQNAAIAYARAHLSKFVHTHEKDIQMLMGMLLYLAHGVSRSPYAHLVQPSLWADILDTFTKDACTLLGLSVESPLSICINAGCIALPALLNIKQVMQQRQVSGIWNGKDELPFVFNNPAISHYQAEKNRSKRKPVSPITMMDLNYMVNSTTSFLNCGRKCGREVTHGWYASDEIGKQLETVANLQLCHYVTVEPSTDVLRSIEIDVGDDKRFHSIFACPILKQQSTDNNPPMRLVCGHVISRDALNKLAQANKLKCPYCPQEQNPADARIIYF